MDKILLDSTRAKFTETWYRIDNLFDRYAKSIGLNFSTMLVLGFIYESEESYTQKDLCEKLELSKQFVNTIITSFWKQGYVELKEAKDRRRKELSLTEKGKEYAEGILRSVRDAETKAWECFTDEEAIAFVNAMEKYGKSFENALKITRSA